MAFGFAQPFQSRIGPIAQRAAMAMPQAAPARAPDPLSMVAPKFPSLPNAPAGQTTAAPATAPTATTTAPKPTMDEGDLGPGAGAEGSGFNVGDLLMAIFGG